MNALRTKANITVLGDGDDTFDDQDYRTTTFVVLDDFKQVGM